MNFRVRPVTRLSGTVEVPGDKSISHRAALLGALADGVTEVQGYLEGEDCLRTLTAIQMMGVEVTRKGPGHYRIAGVGRNGLTEPADVVDCGNSGTTARLPGRLSDRIALAVDAWEDPRRALSDFLDAARCHEFAHAADSARYLPPLAHPYEGLRLLLRGGLSGAGAVAVLEGDAEIAALLARLKRARETLS